jgi:site-specific DNA recombinase
MAGDKWRGERFNPPVPPHPHPDGCGCTNSCAYIRVSAVMGREETLISPQYQLDVIAEWAPRHGKRIVAVVPDIDESGKSFTKRKVAELIAEISSDTPRYSHVSLWKWSRWGRTRVEEALLYVGMVIDAGGEVDSATEDIDQETAMGEFNLTLNLALARLQSRQIGDNWKGAHAIRRRAGLPHNSRPRFGYSYVDDAPRFEYLALEGGGFEMRPDPKTERGKGFAIDPVSGPVLTEAYEMYVHGTSNRKLAVWLNDAGFLTTLGGRWTAQAVGHMLDTGFAAGYLRERSAKERKRKSERTGRPVTLNSLAAFDVWRHGCHEALISEELWQAYQARRTEMANLAPRLRAATHALSSMLRCGVCGRLLVTKYSGRDSQHQWICPWAESQHPGTAVSISNSIALFTVRARLAERAAGGEVVDERTARLAMAQNAQADVTAAQRKLVALNAKLARQVDLYEDGVYATKAEYTARRAKVEKELREVQLALSRARERVASEGHDQLAYFTTIDEEWDEWAPQDQHDAIAQVVGVIVVFPAANGRGRVRVEVAPPTRLRVVWAWEMGSFVAPWPPLRRAAL